MNQSKLYKNKFRTSLLAGVTACLAIAIAMRAQETSQVVPEGPVDEEPQQATADSKISREVREQAENNPTVAVFIVLKSQPQREIFRRWNQRHANQIAALDQQVADRKKKSVGASRAAVQEAAALRDEAITTMRKGASLEARQAVASSQDQMIARLTGLRAHSIYRLWAVNTIAAEIPSSILEDLERDPEVERVYWQSPVRLNLETSTAAIGAPAVWDAGFTGGTQSAAVIDSGINPGHPMFSGIRLVPSAFLEAVSRHPCFLDDKNDPRDQDDHGSHVAGIVAGQGFPGAPGALGVAHGIGSLISIRVFAKPATIPGCPRELGDMVDILQAVEAVAAQTSARVLNLSLGFLSKDEDDYQSRFIDAVADFSALIVVVSAGNQGSLPIRHQVGSPGNAYNIISVANVDTQGTVDRSDDQVDESSSKGPTPGGRYKPDLAAPGTNILSAGHRLDMKRLTGTSMAAPHVAGAAALLLDAGVKGPLEVKALLLNSTDTAGWRRDWGWGSMNLERALSEKDNLISSSVQAAPQSGSVRFWKGRVEGSVKATLTWNRHLRANAHSRIALPLSDLNLGLYGASTNRALSTSTSRIQNVEQVAAVTEGEVVLTVSNLSNSLAAGTTQEDFALALSAPHFVEVRGPVPELRCDAPLHVIKGSFFEVRCMVTNTGDLTAHRVTAALSLPKGFTSSNAVGFGDLDPGMSSQQTIRVGAPQTSGGLFRYTAVASTASYGVTISRSQSLDITVTFPELTVEPATLDFNQVLGTNAFQVKTISVKSAGGAVRFRAATSGGGWLRVNTTLETTPASLLVSVAAGPLPAGKYEGIIRLTPIDTSIAPVSVPVTFTVRLPSFGVTARMMTKLVSTRSCPVPQATAHFAKRDGNAFVWFSVTGAAAGDRWRVDWISPSGAAHRVADGQPLDAGGDFCMWDSLALAHPTVQAGNWQARVFWNGSLLFTEHFQVVP